MSKSMRKLICLILTLCLVLGSAPAAFAITETTVTSADALKAALENGGNIKLGKTFAVNESLTVAKDTVLDLNGYTLTVDPGKYINYAVLVSAALTVKDSKTGGKLTSGGDNGPVSTIFLDYGEGAEINSFTLLSGTIENTVEAGSVIVALGTRISTVNISGGTVISNTGEGEAQGYSVFAQGDVHITGGNFGGALNLSEEGRTSRQTVTGGHFDKPFGMHYYSGDGNRIDFYGTRYEVIDNGAGVFPYEVAKAFDGGVTVSYHFAPGSGLEKRDDVFIAGTTINEPSAPYASDIVFEAWYIDFEKDIKAVFPMTVDEDITFIGNYEDEQPGGGDYHDDFLDAYYEPANIIVGGTVMLQDGVLVTDTAIGNISGSALLQKTAVGGTDAYVLYLIDYESDDIYHYDSPSGSFDAAIYSDGPLLIGLMGENYICAFTENDDCGAAGIAVEEGGLWISDVPDSGSGSLEIRTSSNSQFSKSVGIYTAGGTTAEAIDILIENSIIDIDNDTDNNSGLNIGIMAGMNLEMPADLIIYQSEVSIGSVPGGNCLAAAGLYANGDITIEKSNIDIAPDCTFASSGIECEYLDILSDDETECVVNVMSSTAAFTAVGIAADQIRAAGPNTEVFAVASDAVLDSIGVSARYGVVLLDGAWLSTIGGSSESGNSCGLRTDGLYVFGNDEGEDIVFTDLWAAGGDSASGNSTGIQVDTLFYSEYGGVFALAHDAAMYSDGIYMTGNMLVAADSKIESYGGTAGEYSYGICVEGTATIYTDADVTALGGDAGIGSRGMYLEQPDDISPALLAVYDGGTLIAEGGIAESNSCGVKVQGGYLEIMDNGAEYTEITKLDAFGGTAPESYGIYVQLFDDYDGPAITAADEAMVRTEGGQASYDGEGKSRGIWADGSIEISGAAFESGYVPSHAGNYVSDNTFGICLRGENLSLSVKNNSYVIAEGTAAEYGCAGLYFETGAGVLDVEQGSQFFAYAQGAEKAVGIYNLNSITADGDVMAVAEEGDGYGIIMATDAAIAVPVGSLEAYGPSAAIICQDGGVWKGLYVTASAIEYSNTIEGHYTDLVTPIEGFASLFADDSVKQILAASGGQVEGVAVENVNTALTYGQTPVFTAQVYPRIAVKVVEESWERLSDHAVFSSLDQTPAAITAGTYRYTLTLDVTGPAYEFSDDVIVVYNGDVTDAYPTAGGILIVCDEEYFVADVTVSAPAQDGGGSGSSGSTGGTNTQTNADGTTTTTKSNTDGGKTVTTTAKDGTSVATTTDKNNSVKDVTVMVSKTAADTARSNGAAVEAPASVPKETVINVKAPSDKAVDLALPVANANSGTVLYMVGPNGSRELVKDCITDDGKLIATVKGDCQLIASDNTKSFTDVEPLRWSYDDIRSATAREILNGNGDGTIGLHDTVLKGMISQVFYNMEKDAKPGDISMYTDSSKLLWFGDSTGWATSNKILNGNPDGSSGGMDAASREVTITMFHRYAKFKGMDTSVRGDLSKFKDYANVRAFSKEAMEWAVGSGLINGDNGRLDPEGLADKEQLAAMTVRFIRIMHNLKAAK